MEYRELGNTGIRVSEIGIGCEGFADHDGRFTKELIDLAEEKGVNYLDLYISNPQIRDRIGEALEGRRERFILQARLSPFPSP